jgi:hypothetical protein
VPNLGTILHTSRSRPVVSRVWHRSGACPPGATPFDFDLISGVHIVREDRASPPDLAPKWHENGTKMDGLDLIIKGEGLRMLAIAAPGGTSETPFATTATGAISDNPGRCVQAIQTRLRDRRHSPRSFPRSGRLWSREYSVRHTEIEVE